MNKYIKYYTEQTNFLQYASIHEGKESRQKRSSCAKKFRRREITLRNFKYSLKKNNNITS
jgi:hypothetical protein